MGDVSPITVNFGENLQGQPGLGTAPPENHSYRSIQIPGGTTNFGNLALTGASNAGTGATAADPVFAEFDSEGKFLRLVQNIVTDANGYVSAAPAALGDTDMVIQVPGADDITIPIFDSTTTPITNLFEKHDTI